MVRRCGCRNARRSSEPRYGTGRGNPRSADSGWGCRQSSCRACAGTAYASARRRATLPTARRSDRPPCCRETRPATHPLHPVSGPYLSTSTYDGSMRSFSHGRRRAVGGGEQLSSRRSTYGGWWVDMRSINRPPSTLKPLFRLDLHFLQLQGDDVEDEGGDQDDALEGFLEVDVDPRQQIEAVAEEGEDQQAERGVLHAALAAEQGRAAEHDGRDRVDEQA